MADPGTRFLGRGKPGKRQQPAHESLSSRATRAEVPLTGLSFEKDYPPKIKVSDVDLEAVNIQRNKFHGEWNYEIRPQS